MNAPLIVELLVEPLPDGQAWVRGDRSSCLTIQVRPRDLETVGALMTGTRARRPQYAGRLFQRGLQAELLDRAVSE